MKRNNQIVRRWIVPILILAVAAAVCTTVLLAGGGPDDGAPTPHLTERPQLAVTGPEAPLGAQTPSEQSTAPEQSAAPEQTESAPQPTEPAQTQPDADSSGIHTQPVQTEPVELSGAEDLQCREFARFSGQYVEDGRDELVEHVAAILVTNESDQFLDLATITYDIDGETAVFVVTGLPAGRSAWVMEAKRMVIPDGAVFTPVETVTSFRDGVTAQTGEITLSADANMLTAVNNTDRTLENVFVYYKTLHTDGNFFGGITYRVEFGTLEPGCAAEALAGHYSGGDTEIVRIGWTEQG